jgi:hypothetical protein
MGTTRGGEFAAAESPVHACADCGTPLVRLVPRGRRTFARVRLCRLCAAKRSMRVEQTWLEGRTGASTRAAE